MERKKGRNRQWAVMDGYGTKMLPFLYFEKLLVQAVGKGSYNRFLLHFTPVCRNSIQRNQRKLREELWERKRKRNRFVVFPLIDSGRISLWSWKGWIQGRKTKRRRWRRRRSRPLEIVILRWEVWPRTSEHNRWLSHLWLWICLVRMVTPYSDLILCSSSISCCGIGCWCFRYEDTDFRPWPDQISDNSPWPWPDWSWPRSIWYRPNLIISICESLS